ncbi:MULTISPECIES: hypothetical protein [unclassified Pantoea]|uniref:hypothetical protein n=1 Tax=unclassified Pantoea TaxID=2630326 RepID=UPI002063958B|nr:MULTISPECIES: hypothetical protein [unclassified Pantoea]MDU5476263.1 hypothetical protein [Pantoea sp.]DAI68103.1 MAG TPA: hypothetical protein [Caudoviricetes sp.]
MSTTATMAAISASNAAISASNASRAEEAAHRAEIAQCKISVEKFSPTSGIADKQQYAKCIEILYPTESDEIPDHVLKPLVGSFIITLLVFAVIHGYRDRHDGFFLGALLGIAMGILAYMIVGGAILGISYVTGWGWQ